MLDMSIRVSSCFGSFVGGDEIAVDASLERGSEGGDLYFVRPP